MLKMSSSVNYESNYESCAKDEIPSELSARREVRIAKMRGRGLASLLELARLVVRSLRMIQVSSFSHDECKWPTTRCIGNAWRGKPLRKELRDNSKDCSYLRSVSDNNNIYQSVDINGLRYKSDLFFLLSNRFSLSLRSSRSCDHWTANRKCSERTMLYNFIATRERDALNYWISRFPSSSDMIFSCHYILISYQIQYKIAVRIGNFSRQEQTVCLGRGNGIFSFTDDWFLIFSLLYIRYAYRIG
jgi:hypothetical protein